MGCHMVPTAPYLQGFYQCCWPWWRSVAEIHVPHSMLPGAQTDMWPPCTGKECLAPCTFQGYWYLLHCIAMQACEFMQTSTVHLPILSMCSAVVSAEPQVKHTVLQYTMC